jgi:hypothetical protein
VGVLAVLALALAPATASALTCVPSSGALSLLQHTPVSFVGEAVGHRDKLTVFRVQEAFKGVAAGQQVEVFLTSWGTSDHYLPPVGQVQSVVAGYGPDGILRTQLCMEASAEALRAAAAAQREGRRCGSGVWSVRARSARGRLTLRIAVRDRGGWAERVEVRWGALRRSYPLPPSAGPWPAWRRIEVRRRYRLPRTVLLGVSLVRSELSHAVCGVPSSPQFADRTLWARIR